MSTYLKFFSILLLILGSFSADAQSPTEADYKRAEDFQKNIRKKVFHLNVAPNWLADSSGFWYLATTRAGRRFMRLDLEAMQLDTAFDHRRLAEMLSDSLGEEVNDGELPFNRIRYPNQSTIAFSVKSKTYHLHLNTYELELQEPQTLESPMEEKSPDGKWIAFQKDYNLYIRSLDTGEEFQLSKGGNRQYVYASYYGWADIIEGEGGSRPDRFWVNWSPDSKKILTQAVDLRAAEKMYLLDWSVDTLYRPRLLSYYRGSPGDSTIVYLQPLIYDVEKHKEIKTNLPAIPHFQGIGLRWMEEGRVLRGSFLERGYKTIHYIEVDPSSGKVDTLYSESSPTNINFYNYSIEHLDAGYLSFFTSEYSGWSQLYQLNRQSKNISALTNGEYVIKDLVRVDEKEKRIYFIAAGKEKGRNPYFNHLYSINFDGAGLKLLTSENAHHEINISPDGQYFTDNYSTVDQPTVSVLRSMEDGRIVFEISKADVKDLLTTGWKSPEEFEATARDGKTKIYGAYWKPTHFDPSKKYPVIDASYTGPHTFVFPRSFSQGVSGGNQALAEFGFIVLRVDGLGSAGRSKAFHNWSYGKLGENLGDHVEAIRQLGARNDWLDTTRVGIFGHSAGGYDAAHALIAVSGFLQGGRCLFR